MTSQRDVMGAALNHYREPNDENLRLLLSRIEEYYLPPPEKTCSWCGLSASANEDAGFGPLTDISVMTANGEEGFAHEIRWACQDHLVEITTALIKLGFASHRHGGINFLEPMECPGRRDMHACPTPDGDEPWTR